MSDHAPILAVHDLAKFYDSFVALNNIHLEIRPREFFTIVGPSGSGKTTLLKLLVGLESPSVGDIFLNGKRINDVPSNRRPTCMVFQSLALFPHKTVGRNIEFPLEIKKVAGAERRNRVLELLKMLRLPENYYGKNVAACSGGERQRIALARALAYDPMILFFDEPLSAIDYRLRKTLQKELKELHRKTGKTFVYVTHSLEEAMVMSDRIGIMRRGQIEQIGDPNEIYNRPKNSFVAYFMGDANIMEIEISRDGRIVSPICGGTRLCGPSKTGENARYLMVRPESIRFLRENEGADNELIGRIVGEYALGSRTQYDVLASDGQRFFVERPRAELPPVTADDRVRLGWSRKDGYLLEE